MGARIISIFTTRMMMNDRFLLLSFSIFLLFSCNNHKENMCLSLIKVGRFACHRSTLYSPVWKIKTYIFLPAKKNHTLLCSSSFISSLTHQRRRSSARCLGAVQGHPAWVRAHAGVEKRGEEKHTHTKCVGIIMYAGPSVLSIRSANKNIHKLLVLRGKKRGDSGNPVHEPEASGNEFQRSS